MKGLVIQKYIHREVATEAVLKTGTTTRSTTHSTTTHSTVPLHIAQYHYTQHIPGLMISSSSANVTCVVLGLRFKGLGTSTNSATDAMRRL